MASRKRSILAISGGSDSRYLLELLREAGEEVILAHVNHGTRGEESEKDQEFVEELARTIGYPCVTARMGSRGRTGAGARSFPETPGARAGFENRARQFRRRFLLDLKERSRAGAILLAHTADDQVETILMRFFKGHGVSGLKGIPGESAGGMRHPILHLWKEDISGELKKKSIPYREDRTNADTRFERNWVRHVLIPLLVVRYGKTVKKRIYAMGERFRELDDYLEAEARKWMARNVRSSPSFTRILRRIGFSRLPSALRVKVLQMLCFQSLNLNPNERLLMAMDRIAREGGPSARLKLGQGWELVNRYGEVRFVPCSGRGRQSVTEIGGDGTGKARKWDIALPGPGSYRLADPAGEAVMVLSFESRRRIAPNRTKPGDGPADRQFFDATALRQPLSVRALREGDRIRPFGLESEKKVKEILIDRKVPRNERWGRPVVCDAGGTILWIPGVVRSAHAPVTPRTRMTVLLQVEPESPRMAKPSAPSRSRSRK
jgi:tRNA(Ile)-lysidine synthase